MKAQLWKKALLRLEQKAEGHSSNCFSAVAAPCSLTQDESGYLVPPASSHNLFAKLYLNKLQRSDFGGNLPQKLDLRIYGKGGIC